MSSEKEILVDKIEEFARLQSYMMHTDKNAESYPLMKDRYTQLKVILQSFGVNLDELDHIKE